MSKFGDRLESCFVDGRMDLRLLMENFSINFDNLSLNDLYFIESESREVRQKIENAEKVECYKAYRLQHRFGDTTSYFSLDEVDLVKSLANEAIASGFFDFEIKKIKISKDVLTGHIRDRKEWYGV